MRISSELAFKFCHALARRSRKLALWAGRELASPNLQTAPGSGVSATLKGFELCRKSKTLSQSLFKKQARTDFGKL